MGSELRRVPGATLEHTRKGGRRGGEKEEGEVWRKGVGAGKGQQRGEEEGAGRSRDRTVRQKALRTCPSETKKSGEKRPQGGEAGRAKTQTPVRVNFHSRPRPSGSRSSSPGPGVSGVRIQRARLGSAPARPCRPALRGPQPGTCGPAGRGCARPGRSPS